MERMERIFSLTIFPLVMAASVAAALALLPSGHRPDLIAGGIVFAVGLIVFSGLPYLLGFGIGMVAAVALGVIVELAFVRRFAKASRLVLTVATIGISSEHG